MDGSFSIFEKANLDQGGGNSIRFLVATMPTTLVEADSSFWSLAYGSFQVQKEAK